MSTRNPPDLAQAEVEREDLAQSLQVLALQFSDLLQEVAQLHELKTETRVLQLRMGRIPEVPGLEREALNRWAGVCGRSVERLQSISLSCAQLIDRHAHLLNTHRQADATRRAS